MIEYITNSFQDINFVWLVLLFLSNIATGLIVRYFSKKEPPKLNIDIESFKAVYSAPNNTQDGYVSFKFKIKPTISNGKNATIDEISLKIDDELLAFKKRHWQFDCGNDLLNNGKKIEINNSRGALEFHFGHKENSFWNKEWENEDGRGGEYEIEVCWSNDGIKQEPISINNRFRIENNPKEKQKFLTRNKIKES